ncbi:MAG: S8 family serine peptidase [Bacteroidales bacterium]|jgi:subtilisin family serine protease|nr:S8 family serine peptidase [Bacteroidales bacterium]
MKIRNFVSISVIGMLLFSACSKEESVIENSNVDENLVTVDSESGEIIEGQYVVVLNDRTVKFASDASYDAKVEEMKSFAKNLFNAKSSIDIEIDKAYVEALNGFSVKMSEEIAAEIEKHEKVKYILPDRMYIMKKPVPDPDPDPTGQEVPYGIARVGYSSGIGKTAWIIDTGIDLDHPDLNVDQTRGRNFIRTRKSPDDDNGHGSHCAGTVAAIDNSIGVVGVAAGATVVPVKVLDRRGSGAYSVIIAGIDYVASVASSGDAANMSLGGGAYQPIDDAVYAASQNGIYFSLAAGNESDDANNHSPARVNGPNIFTISAMDINDNWAYFSNYGNPPVDYCEPGYSIYSTYKKGSYTTMSGTSMAAPHMCGILLMTNGNPRTDGTVNGDPDGNADPIGTI